MSLRVKSTLIHISFMVSILIMPVSYAREQTAGRLHVVKGKYDNYYHFEFTLTKDNVLPGIDSATIKEGGMFEVFVKKEAFPIPAPACKKAIIIRMPWSDVSVRNGRQNIEKKQQLFRKIQDVASENSTSENVDVIIELNPYVKVRQQNPLSVELTKCNVFFRHHQGQYVDYLGKK